MKKTIIAAAVAASVAAPAVFADVKISGMVNPEFVDTEGTTGWATSNVNTDLVFTGSEDLGNGLAASFKYHMVHDSGTDSVADTTVTLAGDFGKVIAGRMESFHESVSQAFLSVDHAHDADLENDMDNIGVGDRVNSALAYVSPTVGGFHVGVAMIQGTAGAESDSFNAATDVIAVYENAGLKVFANRLSADGLTTTAAVAASAGPNGLDNDADDVAAVAAVNSDVEMDAIGASYKMGDLEVRALKRSVSIGNAADVDTEFFGAKYTMGANSIAVGTMDNDTNGDSNILSIGHALSKRTSVYVTSYNTDRANADTTTVGIKHTF
jgi:predicted porin